MPKLNQTPDLLQSLNRLMAGADKSNIAEIMTVVDQGYENIVAKYHAGNRKAFVPMRKTK